ncbi:MAG: hypothetical protein ACLFU6_06820, partial [Candidatus Hydrogenedentota bacterium]
DAAAESHMSYDNTLKAGGQVQCRKDLRSDLGHGEAEPPLGPYLGTVNAGEAGCGVARENEH